MKMIKRALARPEGIIIVTGPTGSGKTTSLYSMLNAVNNPEVNIMTLEDPVEYSLPLIRQAAVRDSIGLTFANGVKSLLRQDPDIIFIGEVRDGPTAEQALKAAMTGHQVFTTLHTNDCFGALPRLLDLGLQPGMIAGAIIASFAQRLVRRLCPHCKRPALATAEECQMMKVDPANPPTIYHPGGCPKCENNGYKGRIAIAEILVFDDDLDDIVANSGHKSAIKAKAMEKGFRPMADDGVEKVLQGMTSIEALMKVVNLAERLG
jgi:type IV pilus assembly protein PilB